MIVIAIFMIVIVILTRGKYHEVESVWPVSVLWPGRAASTSPIKTFRPFFLHRHYHPHHQRHLDKFLPFIYLLRRLRFKFYIFVFAVPGDGLLLRRRPSHLALQVRGPAARGHGQVLHRRDGKLPSIYLTCVTCACRCWRSTRSTTCATCTATSSRTTCSSTRPGTSGSPTLAPVLGWSHRDHHDHDHHDHHHHHDPCSGWPRMAPCRATWPSAPPTTSVRRSFAPWRTVSSRHYHHHHHLLTSFPCFTQ